MTYIRYHIDLGDKRTTISLDDTVAALLALELGTAPDSDNAHTVVRTWLQDTVDGDPGKFVGDRLSYWLRREAILTVSDNKLSKRYVAWWTDV